jgi:acid phosphatase
MLNVTQMGRHGSRYPLGSELTVREHSSLVSHRTLTSSTQSVTGLVSALANASKAITKAKLPDDLQFLKAGYVSTLGTNDLTAPGRQELFDAGVKYVG